MTQAGAALAYDEVDDYVAFSIGIRLLAGIDLLQYKRGQMERRIRALADRHAGGDLAGYLQLLERDADLLGEMLDRITINVSQLWRNPEQWEQIGHRLVPELAASGRIRVWSAGCSHGAEAYTLAAVCLDHAPAAQVSVLGTDIDRRMIERANVGRFTFDEARSAPLAELERWFELDDEGGWLAGPELRAVTRFETGDLLRSRIPRDHYDLVLCRNVVIYFTREAHDGVHARLSASLRESGYLVVGVTERVFKPAQIALQGSFPFVYQKQ